MDIKNVYQNLAQLTKNSEILLNEEMSKHTTLKIGGVADIFIKAKTVQDIENILKYAKENNIQVTIVGNGSNLLVKDEGIRGITLKLELDNIQIEDGEEGSVLVTAEAGVKLGVLGMKLANEGIHGFEFATGIPGTIGGAVRMNAGAFKKEFKDIVLKTTYIDENLEIRTSENEGLNFSYRHSRFAENRDVIISCQMKFYNGNKDEILAKIKEYADIRKEKQPLDMPNAGSTFKRGTDFITAQLIDEAGLKGYTIGGAQVSLKHSGFIVNTGNATAKDVLALIDYVTKVIFDKYGKVIEMEIEIAG